MLVFGATQDALLDVFFSSQERNSAPMSEGGKSEGAKSLTFNIKKPPPDAPPPTKKELEEAATYSAAAAADVAAAQKEQGELDARIKTVHQELYDLSLAHGSAKAKVAEKEKAREKAQETQKRKEAAAKKAAASFTPKPVPKPVAEPVAKPVAEAETPATVGGAPSSTLESQKIAEASSEPTAAAAQHPKRCVGTILHGDRKGERCKFRGKMKTPDGWRCKKHAYSPHEHVARLSLTNMS